jgi:ankyrin repeat protein
VRELLARGADVNARANDGFAALHSASWKGHAEVVRELLSRGAAINTQADNGATPLTCACDTGHLAAATLLLNAGADLALLTITGHSALFYAERRVELDGEEPEEGAEPPTAAQVAEHKALVALLEARGAA